MTYKIPQVGLLAALAFIVACSVNPATGERQLVLIGEGSEIRMGRDADGEITASLGIYDDPDLQAYITQLGNKLAATSERPNLPWSFKVVDDPIVNAFALPGGFIYITRGIMAHFNSEAQLAWVVGHEIGHVTGRHSVEQLSRAQLAQVGLVAGVLIVPEQFQGALGAASVGLQLMFLKFGRDDERQADDLGLRYIDRAGYDPREMPGVFAMLGRVSTAAGGGRVPEWLSTHPNPENRAQRIAQAIARSSTPGISTSPSLIWAPTSQDEKWRAHHTWIASTVWCSVRIPATDSSKVHSSCTRACASESPSPTAGKPRTSARPS